MMTETQIEAAAAEVVVRLWDAANGAPENVLDGVVAVQIDGENLSAAAGVGIWKLRHGMDAVAAAVAAKLGVPEGGIVWDHNRAPGPDKAYVFNAPVDAFLSEGKKPADIRTRLADAERRETDLRDALALFCSAAKPVEGIPDVFVIRRADVEEAMNVLLRNTLTVAG